MKLLIIASPDASAAHFKRLAEIRRHWTGRGHDEATHQLDGPVEYGELLDVVLAEQADVMLLAGMAGDDSLVRSIADVAWKFDNAIRVVVEGPATGVPGVLAAGGPPESVVDCLDGQEPGKPAKAGPVPSSTRPLLVSRGWMTDPVRYLSEAAAQEIIAGIGESERRMLAFSDADGYRHVVGVPAAAPSLLRLLDDARLGELMESAIGTSEVWLGALEVLVPESPGWRRELAGPRRETGSASFRPGLSLLIALDPDGGRAEVQPGSHRLAGEQASEPRDTDCPLPARGEAVLIEGGCRFRLSGRFVHLRFIRGWMKPDVLLAEPLRELADGMGRQARQWCGMDIGLATSVEEFLRTEEAALAGGLAQRKGSGV